MPRPFFTALKLTQNRSSARSCQSFVPISPLSLSGGFYEPTGEILWLAHQTQGQTR